MTLQTIREKVATLRERYAIEDIDYTAEVRCQSVHDRPCERPVQWIWCRPCCGLRRPLCHSHRLRYEKVNAEFGANHPCPRCLVSGPDIWLEA
jgi:hypothetical protein